MPDKLKHDSFLNVLYASFTVFKYTLYNKNQI
jgi:hypothetical protein